MWYMRRNPIRLWVDMRKMTLFQLTPGKRLRRIHTENALRQSQEGNEAIHRIHEDWLTPDKQRGRQLQDVNKETIRRMGKE